MLDIGFDDNGALSNIRITGAEMASGEAVAEECTRELASIKGRIAKALRV